jgi:FtsP/CotA-like multicopper oxidase with cupredoxin domain
MTTAIELLDSIRAHLATFELPDLWSVHVVASFSGPNVTVQLARRDSPEIAGALLAWANTLTGVTAEAWRVPHGDTVHLSVIGQLPGGVSIRVHGGMPFTESGIGGNLAPDASATVPLVVLRQRATLKEVTI